VAVLAAVLPLRAGDDSVAEVTGIAAITDGDTIAIGPVRIRLHGIDAPEAGQTCGTADGGAWPCGDRATERLAELAEGKPVRCVARERDAYGRIIAVCTVSRQELNAAMIREGFAWAFVRYSADYAGLEEEARAARIGIWQGPSEAPWDYRDNRWNRAAAASPAAGCPIKGNISRSGKKIYHTPWSPAYERTVITESAGERWFCDEAEALAAGWRPARWR
jgi:endonuclease YncB( thermonuclease family)